MNDALLEMICYRWGRNNNVVEKEMIILILSPGGFVGNSDSFMIPVLSELCGICWFVNTKFVVSGSKKYTP